MERCHFAGNVSLQSGGAVCNGPSGALFGTNCVFASNAARGGNGESRSESTTSGGGGGGGAGLGGAIYSEGSVLALNNCMFDGNTAIGGDGGNGGGNHPDYRGGDGGGLWPGLGGNFGQVGFGGGFGSGGGGGGGNDGFNQATDHGGPGGFGGGGGGAGASRFGLSGGHGGAGGGYGGNGGPSCFSFAGGGGGGAGLGGALFTSTGAVTVANCSFDRNCATNGHGGFGCFGGGLGTNGTGVGGAIFNLNAALTVVDTDYAGNKASTFDSDFSTPTLVTIEPVSPTQLRLTWTPAAGTLQSAPTVMGPWSNVPGATSGAVITINSAEAGLFYRVVR